MSKETEKIENHLRHLAEAHEPPYEPSDWAVMHKRLKHAGLTQGMPSPLYALARRYSILVIVFFLVGVKTYTNQKTPFSNIKQLTTNSKQNTSPTNPDRQASSTTNSPTNTDRQASSITNSPTNPDRQASSITNSPTNADRQASSITNSPTNPDRQASSITNSPINPDRQASSITNLPTNTDRQASTPILETLKSIQILGLSTTEGFMQKELANTFEAANSSTSEAKKTTGYKHIDFYTSESLHTNLAFKIGSEHLYNIFAVGYQFNGGGRLGIGYGFGKELRKRKYNTLNLEAVGYYIRENNNGSRLNLLAQTKIQFMRQITPRLTGFMGAGINILASDNTGDDLSSGTGLPNWAILQTDVNGTHVKLWTSLNLGISMRLE